MKVQLDKLTADVNHKIIKYHNDKDGQKQFYHCDYKKDLQCLQR